MENSSQAMDVLVVNFYKSVLFKELWKVANTRIFSTNFLFVENMKVMRGVLLNLLTVNYWTLEAYVKRMWNYATKDVRWFGNP